MNGLRLTPPVTWYGSFTLEQPWMFLPIAPVSSTTVSVYIGGVLYTTTIPFATGTNPSSPYPFKITGFSPPPLVVGQFVFYDNLMIALDNTFVSDDVVVVLEFLGQPPDYTVVSGVLTINTLLVSDDVIVATIFTNASTMALETVVYPADFADTIYIPMPFAKDYLMVTMNGLELSPDFDYEVENEGLGWDSVPWDSNPWDLGEFFDST